MFRMSRKENLGEAFVLPFYLSPIMQKEKGSANFAQSLYFLCGKSTQIHENFMRHSLGLPFTIPF